MQAPNRPRQPSIAELFHRIIDLQRAELQHWIDSFSAVQVHRRKSGRGREPFHGGRRLPNPITCQISCQVKCQIALAFLLDKL